MASAVDFPYSAAHQQRRQIVVLVAIAVTDAAAVDDYGVIEQRALGVLGRLHLAQEVTQHLDVVLIDFLNPLNLCGVVEMVRQAMMRVRHSHGTVSPVAAFAADHKGNYPSQVSLKGYS